MLDRAMVAAIRQVVAGSLRQTASLGSRYKSGTATLPMERPARPRVYVDGIPRVLGRPVNPGLLVDRVPPAHDRLPVAVMPQYFEQEKI
ncbi:hypothetical protein GCM10012289_31740 [Nonomuraea cavernae]|uniref:Uncharacterized protein n=2 Tax=Nonomuraea cavernae TaxID=2045107 RepID=A0A917Z0P5_9ACTN|nr:hypothetical protein GCM10012289_31740 [Nonomuraea cavernae]